jgi:hypothetical protein
MSRCAGERVQGGEPSATSQIPPRHAATALDYAYARQSLAATVAIAWYLACETRQLLALAEQAVEIYSKLHDLVTIRRAAGKVSDLQVVDARANLDDARGQVEVARDLQTGQIVTQANVIRVRGLQRTNRIQLHLALGGGFNAVPGLVGRRRREEGRRADVNGVEVFIE